VAKHLLLVFANPVEGQEDEFNAFYDGTHLKDMLSAPGVVAAQRFRVTQLDPPQVVRHHYLTVYELETDDPGTTMLELYDANARGDIQPFDALDPDARSLVFDAIGERQTS